MRTTLTSGAWIEHTPIQDLKGGHKRALDRVGKPRLGEGALGADGQFNIGAAIAGMDITSFSALRRDALLALIITGWSYEMAVPELDKAAGEVTGADSFDDIPLDDYEELEKFIEPFAAKLSRRPDPKAKGAAITTASNGSSRASAAHGSRTA